jgi:Permuted papain-like amidase enzyme, YaeF/YiiX, C92 family
MQRTVSRARLEEDLAAVDALIKQPVATANDLADKLERVYSAMFEVSLDRYDLEEVKAVAPDLMRAIFTLRLHLREQVADWHRRGFMSLPVQTALRNALRAGRYATDMLGELNTGFEVLGPGEKTLRAFRGARMNTLVNPAFETGADLPFQAGDLLLMRGMHHNSAAIARVGDVDSQFSHIAIVHTDEQGRQWVVEALIEAGSVINSLDEVLHHDLGRCVVLRHKDTALARRAAAAIFDYVRDSSGRHIWYDFTMELEGRRELFCSKLVRLAYLKASDGKVALPTFNTRFDMKNRDFVDRIGMTARESFAPADILLEPDFDIVAEWQDYRVTSRLRLQDLLMDKLFHWMDAYGYTFRPDFSIRLIGMFGRLSSRLSERTKKLISDVVPKVPPNMSRSAIQAVAMLHKTAEPLLQELLALERQSIAQNGRPLHVRDVFEFLEAKRAQSGGRIGYLVGKA